MNGIEVTVNINLNGEKVAGITTGEQAAETLPPGDVGREVTQEEEQRFAVASDLANVCEYLEDSEVIKIRLIVNKASFKRKQALLNPILAQLETAVAEREALKNK